MTREELINSKEYLHEIIECSLWPGKGKNEKDIRLLTDKVDTVFQERLQPYTKRIKYLEEQITSIISNPEGYHFRDWVKANQWQLHENGYYYKHADAEYIDNDEIRPSARIKDSEELHAMYLSQLESTIIK